MREFSPRFLNDPRQWKWGRVHQLSFLNPIRPSGFLSGCLGGGSHSMDGSGETLYRAIYAFDKPYGVVVNAALRMVADLGDEEKVLAVMPSGVSGRTFDRHYTDQVDEFMSGDRLYWWFSDEAIARHSEAQLVMDPIR
jgi:penicillin amidase